MSPYSGIYREPEYKRKDLSNEESEISSALEGSKGDNIQRSSDQGNVRQNRNLLLAPADISPIEARNEIYELMLYKHLSSECHGNLRHRCQSSIGEGSRTTKRRNEFRVSSGSMVPLRCDDKFNNVLLSQTLNSSRKLQSTGDISSGLLFSILWGFLLFVMCCLCFRHRLFEVNDEEGEHQQQRQRLRETMTRRSPDIRGDRRVSITDPAVQQELDRALQESRKEYIKVFLCTEEASEGLLRDEQKRASAAVTVRDNEDLDLAPCCSICLDEYRPGDYISCAKNTSTCHHLFHEHCITDWLMKHDDCPCCRVSYFDAKTDDNEEAKETEVNFSSVVDVMEEEGRR